MTDRDCRKKHGEGRHGDGPRPFLEKRAGNAKDVGGDFGEAAVIAAKKNTDVELNANCATLGQKLVVRPGSEVVVAIVVRDPSGASRAATRAAPTEGRAMLQIPRGARPASAAMERRAASRSV